jgi:hypothetical protein
VDRGAGYFVWKKQWKKVKKKKLKKGFIGKRQQKNVTISIRSIPISIGTEPIEFHLLE